MKPDLARQPYRPTCKTRTVIRNPPRFRGKPNPFSESQFRTLKYRPEFPERFGSFEDAHAYCGWFFNWYNDDHRHSAIGYHTPADVHYGRAESVRARRAQVLDAAYAAHPERFVNKPPQPPQLPTVAWINPPPERKNTPTTQ